MGIPSYFSYIVKNYATVLSKFSQTSACSPGSVHNFYLDCNSIIYDAVRSIADPSDKTLAEMDAEIIQQVLLKIDEYVAQIAPSSTLFIAFDGVAPVAKMNQQRERRFKSIVLAHAEVSSEKNPANRANSAVAWSTTCITPGTPFMTELNRAVQQHFVSPQKYGVDTIITATSDFMGEGEHKIFGHIRQNPAHHAKTTSVIYGLDADLIMLSINHLPINPSIFLFRETPHFIQTINRDLEPNRTYLINIGELARIIMSTMRSGGSGGDSGPNRVHDYIFLCFFLGNDFMPHFPSINIRTGGIDKMMAAYQTVIGASSEVLTDGRRIYWKNVRRLVNELEIKERGHIIAELAARDRFGKKYYPTDTPEQRMAKLDAIPTIDRELEKSIAPAFPGWRERYYRLLFGMCDAEPDPEEIKRVCLNYLEGLEWTLKYYTTDCPDWRWAYRYKYPPLLCDLIKYIPRFGIQLVDTVPPDPVSSLVQLSYVLPAESHRMLPPNLRRELAANWSHLYLVDPIECKFYWAFCRYFWEAHAELPTIRIADVEEAVRRASLVV